MGEKNLRNIYGPVTEIKSLLLTEIKMARIRWADHLQRMAENECTTEYSRADEVEEGQ